MQAMQEVQAMQEAQTMQAVQAVQEVQEMQAVQCGLLHGLGEPQVLGSQCWDPAGCATMTAQTAEELGSFSWALQRCEQSCWSLPGCRGSRAGAEHPPWDAEHPPWDQSTHHGIRSQLGTRLAARAGAQEPVNTTQKFSLKVWNDLWLIAGCDRVSCQAWAIRGWGVWEDNGDKLGPEGMCAGGAGEAGGRGGAAFSSIPRHNLLSLSGATTGANAHKYILIY